MYKIDQAYPQVEKELIRIAIIYREADKLQLAFDIFRKLSVLGKTTQENDLIKFDLLF